MKTSDPIRSRIAAMILASVLAAPLALGQNAEPPAKPDRKDQPADRPPPPPPPGEGRERGGPPDQMPETFDRDSVKKRLESRLKDLTTAQEKLQKALEKLESGAPLTDVWAEIGPRPGSGRFSGGPGNFGERLNERMAERGKGRDGKPSDRDAGAPREGGPRDGGPRGRRGELSESMEAAASMLNLPQYSSEPLSPEERERLFGYLDENTPKVAERFRQWQKTDPEGFDIFLSRMAPRVREAGAVLRRDPDGAKLRMQEVEKGLDVLDATQKLREIYASPEPDQTKLVEVRESLKTALSAQLEARFATHQHQITTLERQIQELRKQADDMSAKKAEKISERAAAFEASVRERAQGGKGPKGERPDKGPRDDKSPRDDKDAMEPKPDHPK